ncbi:MAG: hypothetical protein WCO71_04730 [Pseudomonadota bacterium]
MKNRIATIISLGLLMLGQCFAAEIPRVLNYQGRVASGGVVFQGVGQFKFALVNADGTAFYWRNDGVSGIGEPTTAVSLNVTKGLFSARIGDTAIENMSEVPASVFQNTTLQLRVWFNDGTKGWQRLLPDQKIGSAAFAQLGNGTADFIQANELSNYIDLIELKGSGVLSLSHATEIFTAEIGLNGRVQTATSYFRYDSNAKTYTTQPSVTSGVFVGPSNLRHIIPVSGLVEYVDSKKSPGGGEGQYSTHSVATPFLVYEDGAETTIDTVETINGPAARWMNPEPTKKVKEIQWRYFQNQGWSPREIYTTWKYVAGHEHWIDLNVSDKSAGKRALRVAYGAALQETGVTVRCATISASGQESSRFDTGVFFDISGVSVSKVRIYVTCPLNADSNAALRAVTVRFVD